MGGVDQYDVQGVFQQVVHAPPVVARRLEHHQRDVLFDQPVPQLQQRVGRGRVGADLLAARVAPGRAWRAHACLEVPLADVQSGTPIVQNVHCSSNCETGHQWRGRPEEPRGLKSLTLVLKQQSTVPVGGPGRHPHLRADEHQSVIGVPGGRTPFSRLHGGQAKRPRFLTRK